LFGRGAENTGIETANEVISPFKGPLHMGHGPVVLPHHKLPGTPSRFGFGPEVFHSHHELGTPRRMRIRRGGIVHPNRSPNSPISPSSPRLRFGPGPVVRQRQASPIIANREYIDSDDVFERNTEDAVRAITNVLWPFRHMGHGPHHESSTPLRLHSGPESEPTSPIMVDREYDEIDARDIYDEFYLD